MSLPLLHVLSRYMQILLSLLPHHTHISSCFRPKTPDIPTVDQTLLTSEPEPGKQAENEHERVARPDDTLRNSREVISLSRLAQIRKKLDTRVIAKEATAKQPQHVATVAWNATKSVRSHH